MSKRYGKPPKGRRNQPGYGENQKCMLCGKILRRVQKDGKLIKVCLYPSCTDYYYKNVQVIADTYAAPTTSTGTP